MDRDEGYEVDPRRADSFYASIRRYWPGLPDGALVPDYAGVRPKLTGPGEPAADFMIEGPAEHGLPGLVHCSGSKARGSPRPCRSRRTWRETQRLTLPLPARRAQRKNSKVARRKVGIRTAPDQSI